MAGPFYFRQQSASPCPLRIFESVEQPRLFDCRARDTISGMSSLAKASVVSIHRAQPEDAIVCGQICYAAFQKINEQHGFPPDLPTPDFAVDLLTRMFSHPSYYCVVAEADGRIVGSNCLDERAAIAGVGPITVHPGSQD